MAKKPPKRCKINHTSVHDFWQVRIKFWLITFALINIFRHLFALITVIISVDKYEIGFFIN